MPNSVDSAPPKNPQKVRAGQMSAARRWGTPATVRIDDLHPAVRQAVLLMIRAGEAAKKGATAGNGSALEVRSDSTTSTPTS